MASEKDTRSTLDWEIYIGQPFRTMRIRIPLEQTAAALRANVSVGALKNLEWGKGSSLSTIIKVARAYGRTAWLEALTPTITVSPMQMLKSQRRSEPSSSAMNRHSRRSTWHVEKITPNVAAGEHDAASPCGVVSYPETVDFADS